METARTEPAVMVLLLGVVFCAVGCSRAPTAAAPDAVITPGLRQRSLIPPPAAEACAGCHESEYRGWLASQHARANRLVSQDEDRAAFVPSREIKVGSFLTAIREDFTIAQTGTDGVTSVHVPEAVIGIDPLVQYLVPFPGGRLQVVDMSYDPRSNEWFNVYGEEDRQPYQWGFWKNRGMNWNSQCAFCHMTGFRKNYDPATDTYTSRWDTMGISCAQCHGSMKGHAAAAGKPGYVPRKNRSTNLVSSADVDNCASCHARREQMTDVFTPGDAFHDHFRLTLADDPAIYYPDGQALEEDYVYGSFLSSRMALKGVTCLDCHDPHSGQLVSPAENNALCLACHAPPGQRGATPIQPVEHGHHAADSAGNRCIECHMPLRTYMQRDPRRDHGFTSPDPVLTEELHIPNACNRCHNDQSTEWSVHWVETWYGEKMAARRARRRARVIARAQTAEADVLPDLLALAQSEENAFWRATLIELLRPWVGTETVRAFLSESLSHTNPLVRAAAVRVLRAAPDAYKQIKPLRKDPVRLVRLDAAWATLNPMEHEPVSYRELLDYLNVVCDQPPGALRRGELAMTEDRPEEAERWVRKAAAWDRSAPAYFILGRVLHAHGKGEEALDNFKLAATLDPGNTQYPYALALLYGEMNRYEDALTAFRKTVELDPDFGRAWYNLGLAYAQLEQLDDAVAALRKAEHLMPGGGDAAYALATVYLRKGDPRHAREAAERVLSHAPSDARARRLLMEIGE